MLVPLQSSTTVWPSLVLNPACRQNGFTRCFKHSRWVHHFFCVGHHAHHALCETTSGDTRGAASLRGSTEGKELRFTRGDEANCWEIRFRRPFLGGEAMATMVAMDTYRLCGACLLGVKVVASRTAWTLLGSSSPGSCCRVGTFRAVDCKGEAPHHA